MFSVVVHLFVVAVSYEKIFINVGNAGNYYRNIKFQSGCMKEFLYVELIYFLHSNLVVTFSVLESFKLNITLSFW